MQTCIVPTICYGIFYTGLTSYGIDLVCKTFNMMYRRIIGHVPHISKINTGTVLTANNIQTPLLTLHQLVEQAHASMIFALQQVPVNDIIHLASWTTLRRSDAPRGTRRCRHCDASTPRRSHRTHDAADAATLRRFDASRGPSALPTLGRSDAATLQTLGCSDGDTWVFGGLDMCKVCTEAVHSVAL